MLKDRRFPFERFIPAVATRPHAGKPSLVTFNRDVITLRAHPDVIVFALQLLLDLLTGFEMRIVHVFTQSKHT